MASMLAAASYYRIGFSLYLAVSARRVRVPGGSKFHLEPGTMKGCQTVLIINVNCTRPHIYTHPHNTISETPSWAVMGNNKIKNRMGCLKSMIKGEGGYKK